MKKKQPYKNNKEKVIQAKEPEVAYGKSIQKTIRMFSSFEEENEFIAKQRYMLSRDERMVYAEQLRKMVFHKYLLPDGTWPPIAKVITLSNPHT